MNAPAFMPMPTAAKSGEVVGLLQIILLLCVLRLNRMKLVLIEVQKADVVYSNIQLSNMWGIARLWLASCLF